MKNKKVLNKKISTEIGVGIVLLVAIVIGGAFYFQSKKEVTEQNKAVPQPRNKQVASLNQNQQSGGAPQNSNQTQEQQKFQTVPEQPGIPLQNIIKQALGYPEDYNVNVTIETNQENHAIGRFTYNKDQYNQTNDGIWFAAKSNGAWSIATTSFTGYGGLCQTFEQYSFPKDMTPDCWDNQKNVLVDTSNPQRFYQNGFTKTDKAGIIQAFISYRKSATGGLGAYSGQDTYLHNKLYLKIDKSSAEYFNGAILIGGIENHSTPYVLAAKQSGKWVYVFGSQDYPPCSKIEDYKFPHDIVDKCYDENSSQIRENLN